MQLQAVSAGYSLPRTYFSGRVHSVFQHACNLRLDDGSLVSLLAATYGNVPQGVRVNTPPDFCFTDYLPPERPFGCRAGIIRFQGAVLSVDLRCARPWRMDLTQWPVDLNRPATRQAWQVAWQALREEGHAAGLSMMLEPGGTDVLAHIARQSIPRFWQATRDCQVDQAIEAIAPLIGLGPGLTPAGDDFIVGALAGLWSTAVNNPASVTFLATLAARLCQVTQHTNDISRTYLLYAMQGEVSEPLATLAQAIGQGQDPAMVRAITQTALQVGSSSGADGTLGLLVGLTAFQGFQNVRTNLI